MSKVASITDLMEIPNEEVNVEGWYPYSTNKGDTANAFISGSELLKWKEASIEWNKTHDKLMMELLWGDKNFKKDEQ